MTSAEGVKGMEAAKLAEYVLGRKKLFILDVRNNENYADWRIEGAGIATVNLPYFELLDDIEPAVKLIPHGEPVLVVCAKEGSSVFVAEQLTEAGVPDVSYLIGGMKAWSEHMEPVKAGDLKGGGELYQFVRPGKGCLSYMIISGGEAVVVDAMRMTERYLAFAAEKGAVIRHAIDTHLHADHLSGGRRLAEQTGADYWLPPKDAEEVGFAFRSLDEGAEIAVGCTAIALAAIYSPGHTIGSTTLLIDGTYLLTGDILFVSSIGRPDLAGNAESWADDLRETLFTRYKGLPQELLVLPAHYGKVGELGERGLVAAELGELFRRNAGLAVADEAAFRRAVTGDLPPQPHAYQSIRLANMGKLNPTVEEQREMEIGPNRCSIHD
ncbi:MBL fold metallo-hydrolase [Paenibacillus sp. LHD-117]|uniref:MBL fold metallo-hydrolase n=1 Tax=Paenibacillus sp. LHD-117 TaxID=3071412 RepID=UPI0027E10321|nr:MBL fold metallo-hydrolase [Paenibacillus sp. LHD-117]MDQ6422925.1 MBL fold metallo-hydrolase [Paenibacillus sp. LHD-117]